MRPPAQRGLDSGASTHVGRRPNNEDAHRAAPDLGLFAVADGLGGYEGGEIASALAIDAVTEVVRRRRAEAARGLAGASSAFWDDTVAEAFSLAHLEIRTRQAGPLAMMGSTLSALVLAGAGAGFIGHVGDTRIYVLRDGQLRQLTRDHTLLAEISDRGVAVPAEERRVYRNELTRALGLDDASGPDRSTVSVEPGDVFLLCSDGLYEALPAEEILVGLARPRAQDASDALVRRAVRAGAEDNVTAVVVRVPSDGA